MIYLLLGKDSFGKKEFVAELAQKLKLEKVELNFPQSAQEILQQTSGGSLFASEKLVCINGASQHLSIMELLDDLAKSSDTIMFLEDALDKRKKETKELLADKRLKVQEFEIPIGAAFLKWINDRAAKNNFKFAKGAAQEFAMRLGDDGRRETDFDLWLADSEIKKLAAYANGGEIARQDVNNLVSESLDQDIFKVTNAIADGNRELAAQYISDFVERAPGGDEKSKIINLSAILAEQFRGLYAFSSLLARKVSDTEIANLTGFSPGRIFVYKKLLRTIEPKRILLALRKMEALDEEMKTSNNPASLQFYMIITGLMK